MLGAFSSLKNLLKISPVQIDNWVFKLHYKATMNILMMCSLLVTLRQYFGDPIDCLVEKVPAKIMNTYCWMQSTYTIINRLETAVVGKDVAAPGVGPVREGDMVQYHKYYQWVCFVLFFQGLVFYVPRYLWKMWEAGKMKALVAHLNGPIIAEDTKNERKKLLVEFFINHMHNQNAYAARFFFCEFLNLVIVIGQIYLMNLFLSGFFIQYGFEVITMADKDPEDRFDPMARLFPKLTGCTFNKFGPSGTLEQLNGLCVLSLNVLNEKIYVFLWFWFCLLAVTTILALLYRITTLLGGRVREHLLRSQARLAPLTDVQTVARNCRIGDWFVLQLLASNIESIVFNELISDLAARLDAQQELGLKPFDKTIVA